MVESAVLISHSPMAIQNRSTANSDLISLPVPPSKQIKQRHFLHILCKVETLQSPDDIKQWHGRQRHARDTARIALNHTVVFDVGGIIAILVLVARACGEALRPLHTQRDSHQ
jgi:hypothetical protein